MSATPPGMLAALRSSRARISRSSSARAPPFFRRWCSRCSALSIFYFAWDDAVVSASTARPACCGWSSRSRGCSGCSVRSASRSTIAASTRCSVSPISRESIYLGKAIGELVFLLRRAGRRDPGAGAVLQSAARRAAARSLIGIVLLAMIGIVAVGTLFSAMAVNTRLAELLLPMLSLPFFVPIVMTAAQATARLLAGRPIGEAWRWLKILIAFDIVFVVACTLAFPFTLEE